MTADFIGYGRGIFTILIVFVIKIIFLLFPPPRCIDGLAEYHCICPMYYTGIHCEINQNICDILKPCKHEGECVNIHMTDYRCICPEGFTGKLCTVLCLYCVSDMYCVLCCIAYRACIVYCIV